MKKLIAILVSAVLLVTSIFSVSMFTVSAEGETSTTDDVIIPGFVDGNGDLINLLPTIKYMPNSVSTHAGTKVVANTSKLPLPSLFSVAAQKASDLTTINFEPTCTEGTSGYMFYVEVPECDVEELTWDKGTEDTTDDTVRSVKDFRLSFYFYGYTEITDPETGEVTKKDANAYDYMYGGGWYLLENGTKSWVAKEGAWNANSPDTSGNRQFYGVKVPYGFKGYLYVPNDSLDQVDDFEDANNDENKVAYLTTVQIPNLTNDVNNTVYEDGRVEKGLCTEEKPLKISAPMPVKVVDETSKLPAADGLVIGGVEYNYNTGKVVDKVYPDASTLAGVMHSEYSSTGAYISTGSEKAAIGSAYGNRTAISSISSLTDTDSILTNSFRHYSASTTTGNHAAMFQFASGSTLPDGGYLVYAHLPSVEGNHTIYSERYTYAGAYTNCAQIVGSALTWYTLEKGSTTWTERSTAAGKYSLDFADAVSGVSPAWEGWIYIPRAFWRNTTTSTAVEMLSLNPETYRKATASQAGISGWKFSGMTAIKSFDASMTKVVGDNNRVVDLTTNTIIDTNYATPKEFVGNIDIIDNDNAKVLEMNTMALRELPFVGNTVGSTLFDGGVIASGATYVENPSPVTKTPLFSVAGTVGDTATTQGVQFTISSNSATDPFIVNADDIDGFMFYVKNGAKPAPIHLGAATIISSDGATYTTKYGQYNSGKTYLLAKNSNTWKTAAAEGLSSMKLIPANFEGWVYVPKFANMTSQYTKVWRFNIYMATTAEDKTVDLDFGSFMTVKAGTWTEENAGVAFVNGAAVAQDMWTGDFTLVGDENKDFRVNLVDLCYLGSKIKEHEADFPKNEAIKTTLPVTEVENTTSFPFEKLYKVDGSGTQTSITISVEPASAKGFLFYVEVPELAEESRLLIYVNHTGGTAYKWGYVHWYKLAEGDTAWNPEYISNYGPVISGFKGYIYVPFDTMLQGTTPTDNDQITALQLYYTPDADMIVSAPVLVKGSIGDGELPSAESLSSGTKEYSFFGDKFNPSTDAEEYSISYIYKYRENYFANFEPTLSAQFNVRMSVAPLAYSQSDDTTILNENPDRGYRSELFVQFMSAPLTVAETSDYTVNIGNTNYTVTVEGNGIRGTDGAVDGTNIDTDYNINNYDMTPFGVGSGGAVHTVSAAAAKAYAIANSLAYSTEDELVAAAVKLVDNYMQYDFRSGMTNIDVAELRRPVYDYEEGYAEMSGSVSGSRYGSYKLASTREYNEATGELSAIKLLVNHGRRTIFATDTEDEWRSRWSYMFDQVYKIGVNKESSFTDNHGNVTYGNKVTNNIFNAYVQFTEFAHEDTIPDGVLSALDFFFDFCREREVKSCFRPAYNADYTQNAYLSQSVAQYVQFRNNVASQCADEETMIAHIKQIAPVIAENKDVIHKISSGWIGFGGEMAAGYQYPPVSYKNVITAILENHCIPNGLYYSSRSSDYYNDIINGVEAVADYNSGNLDLKNGLTADAEWTEKYAKWCGFNNDAFHGAQNFSGWGSGAGINQPGLNEWENDTANAAYAPNDGEMYTNGNHVQNITIDSEGVYHWIGYELAKTNYRDTDNKIPTGIEAIIELAHHRYTDFSQWHGYLDNINTKTTTTVMELWQDHDAEWVFEGEVDSIANGDPFNAEERAAAITAPLTKEMLEANGILYDPAWFNGNDTRNAYEFIRDHLGYRLVAEDASVEYDSKVSDKVHVSVNLKNYGFAAAFNMKSTLAILDVNGNVVQEFEVGDPSTWYSLAPDYYTVERASSAQGDVLTHNLSAEFDALTKSGTYYVAVKLENTAGTTARFANDIEVNEQGYNILGSFLATVIAQ